MHLRAVHPYLDRRLDGERHGPCARRVRQADRDPHRQGGKLNTIGKARRMTHARVNRSAASYTLARVFFFERFTRTWIGVWMVNGMGLARDAFARPIETHIDKAESALLSGLLVFCFLLGCFVLLFLFFWF